MIIDLSEREIELIKRGLSDHISDYCITDAEEKQYIDLLDKLKKVKEKNS